jgi:hypothetical protein
MSVESIAGRTVWKLECFHRHFLEWEKAGFFEALWKAGNR